jgi:hypothetical protein
MEAPDLEMSKAGGNLLDVLEDEPADGTATASKGNE